MYKAFRNIVLYLLKAPDEAPEPPSGSDDSVKVFRASENYLKFKLITGLAFYVIVLIGEVIGFLFLLAGGAPVVFHVLLGLIILMTVLTLVLNYFLIQLDYEMRYYIVTDRSLRIREGAWTIHESTFTFANVQNISLKQGPVDSLLGISHLIVHTAGGGGGAMSSQGQNLQTQSFVNVLRGIENAPEVRDQIQNLVKKYKDSGLGDDMDKNEQIRQSRRDSISGRFSERSVLLLKSIKEELEGINNALEH